MYADPGEQKRDRRKSTEHLELGASRRRLTRQHVVERTDVGDGLVRIGRVNDLANGGHQPGALPRVANHQFFRVVCREYSVGHLRGRHIHLRLAGSLQAAHLDVANDADDGSRSIRDTGTTGR